MLDKINQWRSPWQLKKSWNPQYLIFTIAMFIVVCGNYSFFRNVLEVYPLTTTNLPFLLSLVCVLWGVISVLLSLFSTRYTLKPTLIFFLLLTSVTAYFMDSFRIIIDDDMIRNTIETNIDESMDLVTPGLFVYIGIIGLLPSFLILKLPVKYGTIKGTFLSQLKGVGIGLTMTLLVLVSFSKPYTSFFRVNKPLRYYTNPTYAVYSAGKFMSKSVEQKSVPFKTIGLDARISPKDTDRKLIIVVVGEAVRADHFSLNGYERETTPLLKQERIINYSDFNSCGTSTAYSVPCMFSPLPQADFSVEEGRNMDNALDIAQRAGVKVQWRDNNSDSKGVALRTSYIDYRNPQNNSGTGKIENRDVEMLSNLQEYIDLSTEESLLIVLHQMGNHGPAYYKRSPKNYEKFTPICETNRLEECSKEEISNSYDNALLYTDYFLSQTIQFLKQNDQHFETAMIYMSDHGESLGEKGVYLHGMPYFIAPDAQKKVPAVIWLGEKTKQRIDIVSMKKKSLSNYSHDNLFHSLLGFFNIETETYDKSLDMFVKKSS